MQALLIIDMQVEMARRIAAGLDCVNPEAPARIADLVALYRSKGWPVLHVHHRATDPASAFHPDAAGYASMPCAEAEVGEAVFVKTTSSAFASTDLAAHLRQNAITDLVVTGAVAGFCVNSTVRAGADLGFRMTVVQDAVLGFGLPAGKTLAAQSAQSLFDATMALLAADFADVTDSAAILTA